MAPSNIPEKSVTDFALFEYFARRRRRKRRLAGGIEGKVKLVKELYR